MCEEALQMKGRGRMRTSPGLFLTSSLFRTNCLAGVHAQGVCGEGLAHFVRKEDGSKLGVSRL